MQGQDWTPVVLRKRVPHSASKPHVERSALQRIDLETERLDHARVGKVAGARIRQARVAQGYKTQADLARALNVKPDIVASYEAGTAIPENALMQKMRRVLNAKL